MDKLRSIYASAYAAVASIIAVIAITVAAEFSVPFKTWVAGFTGHHWITKSWLSVIVFIVFFILFRVAKRSANEIQTRRALFALELTAIIGFIFLLGFFVFEFLKL